MVKQVYEHYANTLDEATLVMKLDTQGKATYERSANARDDSTLGRV